jgi:DNA-directed RNA polymerase subunit omega
MKRSHRQYYFFRRNISSRESASIMARITVEDCLTRETNRFALVLLAARRTKQILNGAKILISDSKIKNKAVVTSLREIASGHVAFMSEEELLVLREQEEELKKVKENPNSGASEESKVEKGSEKKKLKQGDASSSVSVENQEQPSL